MSKKTLRRINRHNDEMAELSSGDRLNRARSITVGNGSNGFIEIIMRADGKHVWTVLSPPEIIELVYQLAASAGCHVLIQPRNDFASWREWNKETFDTKNYFPPLDKGGTPGPAPLIEEARDEEVVAVEMPKQRRKSKRAPASS